MDHYNTKFFLSEEKKALSVYMDFTLKDLWLYVAYRAYKITFKQSQTVSMTACFSLFFTNWFVTLMI